MQWRFWKGRRKEKEGDIYQWWGVDCGVVCSVLQCAVCVFREREGGRERESSIIDLVVS
jgi:hypothetical protein